MLRTHTCGELSSTQKGEKVTLSGWVQNLRDMGGLVFIDLRDRYGVTQINASTLDRSQFEDIKSEYCIQVIGTVVARPDGQTNADMATGEIEVQAESIQILNACKELPYALIDDPATSEASRMKWRFLDLRRRPVLDNIQFRAKMNHFTRNWFTDEKFLEVQTPLFTVSSPEGARDYLIPSRVNPGKFYALPQAPQQYKQLLMVGGVDKYFQIAPCFRDEDPRADRHSCEFYQVDCEMSFVEQADVFTVAESYVTDLVAEMVPQKKLTVKFEHIPYHTALDLYGSDKPDLRFGMQLMDTTTLLVDGGIKFMAGAESIKCIKLDAQYTADISRKTVEGFEKIAKEAGAGGLPWIKRDEKLGGSIGKLVEGGEGDMKTKLQEITDAKTGDLLFFAIGNKASVAKVLNKLRLHLRDTYSLVDDNELAFCWITDFPFYEHDEATDTYDLGHNPFSHVVGGLEALDTDDLSTVQTNQYDMVLNGFEILSGSIRNCNPEVMVKVFEKIGLSEDDVKSKFGAMYEAFQYGAPPHGGFAFGFDRLMMILRDEPSIRECYAFPKSGKAEDVMMGAPAEVDEKELEVLGVKSVVEEE